MSDFPFSIPRRSDDTIQEYVKIADWQHKVYPYINNTDATPSILGATGTDVTILESSSLPTSFDTATGKYTVLNDGIFLISVAIRGADSNDGLARQRVTICKNDVQPTEAQSFMPMDSSKRHFYELSEIFVCSAGDTLSAWLVDNVPNVAAALTINMFRMFIVKIY